MFIKHYFNIANPKELFIKDRLNLLKQLVKASVTRMPFQNLTSFGAFLPCDRATPQFKEVLRSGVKGEGGLCGHLNNFMILHLETLGFDVDRLSGCFRRTGVPMSHQLIKVRIPGHVSKEPVTNPMEKREDRTYIVDVGSGIPLHEPICIEKLPYYGRAGGLNFRYERVDENTLQRVNENGDAIMGNKPSSFMSPQDYTIDLAPRKYSEFNGPVHAIYSNPRSVFLHQGIYCFRYLNFTEDDFEMVCVRGKELILITKETRQVQSFSSYEELKPSLYKYFPMINTNDVELTVKHFSIPFEEAIKMPSNKP
ncbi:Arylamine N-acetyltransferase 1 [Orchesella cincta]|uniref:arylamine N-acetyltransferase n=1 Tax=Orchesella cincta TaxID=48709 RepID=A0A1D2N6Q6_ORCCI|nr:Arylamine N-acetyltransferase 1 [Orchesella cincta]